MIKNYLASCAILALALTAFDAKAHSNHSSGACPAPGIQTSSNIAAESVTKNNYAKAETVDILNDYVEKISKHTCSQGIGVLMHNREAMDPADRTILRANFDTLYSFAVLDLNSPATIVLPDIDRFQILEIVSEEHWIPLVSDKPGNYELNQKLTGSRYAFAIVRTQVNMQDKNDLKAAGEAQDMIRLLQDSKGIFKKDTNFDRKQILSLRSEYNKRREPEGITSDMIFGKKGEISPEMRNFGVAIGWGGLPKEGAVYPMPDIVSATNPQKLIMKNVPMEPGSFWSVTVYDDKGFATGKNYNINSAFAEKNQNDEYVINLGGSEEQSNFLNIFPGWSAVIRIYAPTQEYFNGTWSIPQYKSKS